MSPPPHTPLKSGGAAHPPMDSTDMVIDMGAIAEFYLGIQIGAII